MLVGRGQIKNWAQVAGVLGLVFCGFLLWNNRSLNKKTQETQELPRVQVFTSEAKQHKRLLTLQGHTKAKNAVTLRAETAGYVSSAPLEQGAIVREKTLLIQLKPVDREAHAKGARAALEQKKLAYKAAQRLHDQGFRAKESLLLAKAEQTVAEARLAEALVKLSQLSIQAPFAGIFDKRFVSVGDYVKEGDAVGTLVSLTPLKVAVAVTQDDRPKISVGQQGQVTIKGIGTVKGRVTYVSASATPETRLFPLELEIPNTDQKIVDGLVAAVILDVETVPAHQVPPSSLSLLETGKIGIKAVTSAKIVQFLPVEVIGSDEGSTWVTGLPPRLQVITVGHAYVQAGQEVNPIESPPHG